MAAQPDDPKMFYETHVFCCVNQRPAGHPRSCCADRGSKDLHGYMKARAKELGIKNIRVNQSGCLERCELGPSMVIYPEGVWYTYRTEADIDEILSCHVKQGLIVERLLLRPDQGPRH
jgi:(2Fe-2S) ferredoxin